MRLRFSIRLAMAFAVTLCTAGLERTTRFVEAIPLQNPLAASLDKLEHTQDSLEVVKKNIEDGKAVLVDVRSAEETKKGHVKGAVLLPVQSLVNSPDAEAIRKAIKDGQIVYTYCVVGKRALAGGEALKKLGYDARPLKHSYNDLLKFGF